MVIAQWKKEFFPVEMIRVKRLKFKPQRHLHVLKRFIVP